MLFENVGLVHSSFVAITDENIVLHRVVRVIRSAFDKDNEILNNPYIKENHLKEGFLV